MDYKISLYLDQRRPKGNSSNLFPVKLQVYSLITKKQKYYPTGKDLSKVDYDDIFNSDKNVRGSKNETKIFLQQIASRANEVAKDISPFTFEVFEKKMFRNTGANINIQYHYENKVKLLNANEQISTASNYNLSLRSLGKFLEDKTKSKLHNLTFYDITADWLNRYENYMIKDSDKSRTTVSMYLRALRTIFNDAINDNEIKSETYPFGKGKGKYQIPSSTGTKRALTKEELSKLFNAHTETPEQEKAKDFWFFSYACNGMNIKDIALLKFKNINNDELKYYRAKTVNTKKGNLKEITVYLNDYTKNIIQKYSTGNRDPEQYIFSIISKSDNAVEQRQHIKNFTSFLNLHFDKIAEKEGHKFKVTTYWARHSFATNAIRSGQSMEFVMEALNHSNLKTTAAYFGGFTDNTKKEFADKLMDF